MKEIAIYGAGGFGKEVLTVVQDMIRLGKEDWKFIGFFDDVDCSERLGTLYLGDYQALNRWSKPLQILLAMGWSHVRRKAASRLDNPKLSFPSLISPTCMQGDASRITLGRGSIILSGANLTTDISLGEFVVINLNATVGHDAVMGDFCSLMPSVNVSGNVKMGTEVFIGSGATLLQNIRIGDRAIVGAGAVVTKDVPAGSTVVGIPARIIKKKI